MSEQPAPAPGTKTQSCFRDGKWQVNELANLSEKLEHELAAGRAAKEQLEVIARMNSEYARACELERNDFKQRAEQAGARLSEAIEFISGLVDECSYGDNCPTFGSKHGQCFNCRAREFLTSTSPPPILAEVNELREALKRSRFEKHGASGMCCQLRESANAEVDRLRAELRNQKAETQRIKEIGQSFERQFNSTFEQSCKNINRAVSAEQERDALAHDLEKTQTELDAAFFMNESLRAQLQVAKVRESKEQHKEPLRDKARLDWLETVDWKADVFQKSPKPFWLTLTAVKYKAETFLTLREAIDAMSADAKGTK